MNTTNNSINDLSNKHYELKIELLEKQKNIFKDNEDNIS